MLISVLLYFQNEFSWRDFAIYFFVPVISFLGYVVNKNFGSIAYTFAHSLLGAIAYFAIAIYFDSDFILMAGLIWVSHIGFDCALKCAHGFGYTHLGRIGKVHNA